MLRTCARPPSTGVTLAVFLLGACCYTFGATAARLNTASTAHHLRASGSVDDGMFGARQGQLKAVEWPGRPDRPDSDVPLLPMRSGDTINLRSVGLDLYCNVRDVQLDEPAPSSQEIAGSASGTQLKSVLACSETDTDGPGGSLLVVGKDFLTDEIREDSSFYLKSQRTNKFCAPQPLLSALSDAPGREETLLVMCNKVHYDKSSEWRAVGSRSDPRVIYLQPAGAQRGRDWADDDDSNPNDVWCGPRGSQGLLVCDSSVRAAGRKAALEVVRGGYRPGGDDGGDYPHGGDGRDYPYGDGTWGYLADDEGLVAWDSDAHEYYPSESSDDLSDMDDDDEYLSVYYAELETYHEYESYEAYEGAYLEGTADYYNEQEQADREEVSKDIEVDGKKGKLPFRTGSMVLLTSPYLETACDTPSSDSPYGPYAPEGSTADQLAAQRGSDAALGRRGGKGGSDPYNPYDDGSDGDSSESVVFCDARIPDGPQQQNPPYGPYGSQTPSLQEEQQQQQTQAVSGWWSWIRAIAAEVGASVAGALGRKAEIRPSNSAVEASAGAAADAGQTLPVGNSQWDLDGFVLMGTDFATADVFSGGRVYLKNQNTRKFCRVFGSDVADYGACLEAGHIVCDRTMSGEDTEFVLELIEMEEQAAEEEAEAGDHVQLADVLVAADQWQGAGVEGGRRGLLGAAVEAAGQQNKAAQGLVAAQAEAIVAVGAVAEGGLQDGQWPDGSIGGGDDSGGYIPSGDGGGGYWPDGGGSKGKKVAVLVRLRAPTVDMRYCAPEPRLRGSPILCDLRHPDGSRRQLTTFRLLEATPSYPYPSGATEAS